MVSTNVSLRPSSCVLTSCPRIDLAVGRFPAGKTLSYPLDVFLSICPKWYQHSVFHKPLITPRVGNNYKADQAKHIHTPTKTSTSYTYYLSYWALSFLASAYSLVVSPPPSPLLSTENVWLEIHPPYYPVFISYLQNNFKCTLFIVKFPDLDNNLYGHPNMRGTDHYHETRHINKSPFHHFPGLLYQLLTWNICLHTSCHSFI